MPTSFLDLPRELRDQIYGYVLGSPSGFITITPRASRTNFILITLDPSSYPARFDWHGLMALMRKRLPSDHITFSLRRVCRQIYAETQSLTWAKNAIYFPSFTFAYGRRNCPPTLGVIKTLKTMGQTASRLITSITITMPSLSRAYNTLGKVLNVLASRARHGSFERLELVWDNEILAELIFASEELGPNLHELADPIEREQRICYDYLLDALRTDSEACRYERVIRLPEFDDLPDGYEEGSPVAEEMHFAFGGKLYWGDILWWDNFDEVISYANDDSEESERPNGMKGSSR